MSDNPIFHLVKTALAKRRGGVSIVTPSSGATNRVYGIAFQPSAFQHDAFQTLSIGSSS